MFRKKQSANTNLLCERADNLVAWAATCSIGTFSRLKKYFLILENCDEDHSDFVYGIASVYITSLKILDLKIDIQNELIRRIYAGLYAWDPINGRRFFQDCKDFFERTYIGLNKLQPKENFIVEDTIGAYVFWNTLGHSPEGEETRLARTIGVMLVNQSRDWWTG